MKKLTLHQAQLEMLAILEVFHILCHENDLAYWLSYGTLLGAIRHDGFIPWDDDVDVCMPREDYERFLQIAKICPPADTELVHHSLGNNDRSFFFTKLKRVGTLSATPYGYKSWGLAIDIFPMDEVQSKSISSINFYRKLVTVGIYNNNGPIRDLMKYIAYNGISLLGRQRIYNFITKKFKSLDISSVMMAGIEMPPRKIFSGFQIPSGDIFPLASHKFENSTFNIPADPDKYLRLLYGDYMIIPKEESRETHEVTFLVPR